MCCSVLNFPTTLRAARLLTGCRYNSSTSQCGQKACCPSRLCVGTWHPSRSQPGQPTRIQQDCDRGRGTLQHRLQQKVEASRRVWHLQPACGKPLAIDEARETHGMPRSFEATARPSEVATNPIRGRTGDGRLLTQGAKEL